MNIRKLRVEDAKALWQMQSELDKETKFMMFEPWERSKDIKRVELLIETTNKNSDFLLVAEEGDQIIGFILAQRGLHQRTRHCAYVVIGIRKVYQGQGIGTRFFAQLDQWAIKHKIKRLELTVMVPNIGAKALYEKNGFVIEGIKKASMYVDDDYIDEYYMAKIY